MAEYDFGNWAQYTEFDGSSVRKMSEKEITMLSDRLGHNPQLVDEEDPGQVHIKAMEYFIQKVRLHELHIEDCNKVISELELTLALVKGFLVSKNSGALSGEDKKLLITAINGALELVVAKEVIPTDEEPKSEPQESYEESIF